MKYFYDTEFIDDGKTIDFVSIGVVAEDGREYYAVSSQFNRRKLRANPWLVDNVWHYLPLREGGPFSNSMRLNKSHPSVKPRMQIAHDLEFFLTDDAQDPELWAWYAAYDHVVLCQLWGPMMNLPSGFPLYTRDLRQEWDRQGRTEEIKQTSKEHHALFDAKHDFEIAKVLGIVNQDASLK